MPVLVLNVTPAGSGLAVSEGEIAIGRTGGAGILGLIGRTEITHVVDIMDLPGIVDILRITRTIGLIPQRDTMQHLPPARSLQVSPRD
jgi:hypothetical protein